MRNHNLINVAVMLLAITGLLMAGCSDEDTISPNTYAAPEMPTTGLTAGVEEDNPYGDDWSGIEIEQNIDSSLIWTDQFNEDNYSDVDPQDKDDEDIYNPNDPKNPGGGS
jgi:hypothetical protein